MKEKKIIFEVIKDFTNLQVLFSKSILLNYFSSNFSAYFQMLWHNAKYINRNYVTHLRNIYSNLFTLNLRFFYIEFENNFVNYIVIDLNYPYNIIVRNPINYLVSQLVLKRLVDCSRALNILTCRKHRVRLEEKETERKPERQRKKENERER